MAIMGSVDIQFTNNLGPQGPQGPQGPAGEDAIIAVLSNESHVIPTDSAGNNGNYAGASTTMSIYVGSKDDSNNWTYTASPSSGVTGNLSGRTYTVTNMSTDTGYVDITASRSGYPSISKRFTLSKSKQGAGGQNATVYWLVTPPAIVKTKTGSYSPASITVSAKSQTGSGSPVDYAGRFIIAESTDGSTFIDKYTSSGNESSKTYTPSANIKAVRVRLYLAGGTSTLLDEQVIPVAQDGVDGADGQDATSYKLVVSASAINKSASGSYNPTSITVTAKSQTGTAAPTNYAGRFVISESTDGTNFTDKYTSSSNESTKTYTPSSGIKAVRVRLYMAGGTSTLLDEQTIPVVADGQTTYTWVKYADDANGNGMSDTPDGKRYVGFAFNKTTPTESTNPADYQWSPLYDNVQPGVRNLVLNSALTDGLANWRNWGTATGATREIVDVTDLSAIKKAFHFISPNGNGQWGYAQDNIKVLPNTTYTASFMFQSTNGTKIYIQKGNGTTEPWTGATAPAGWSDGKWHRLSYTWTTSSTTTSLSFYCGFDNGGTGEVWIAGMKLEAGNVATDWTPAPEDVASDIAAAQAAADAANALLGDLSNDNKLTATEKQIVKTQWDAIVAEKPIYDAQADAYGLATQKTAYDNAYNTLNAYLTPLLSDLTTTSDINGATFRANFNTYYSARMALTQAIYNAIKSGLDNGVKQGQLYNGTSITQQDGFKAVRSDNLVQTIMNATAGIKIQNRTNTSQSWQDVFYVDTNGVLTAKGINVVGGTIFGSTITSQDSSSGLTVQIAQGKITGSSSENNYLTIQPGQFIIGLADANYYEPEFQAYPDFLMFKRKTADAYNQNSKISVSPGSTILQQEMLSPSTAISYGGPKLEFKSDGSYGSYTHSITASADKIIFNGSFQANNFVYSDAYDANPTSGGTHVYVRPKSGGEVRATVTGSTRTYVPMRAKEYNPPNSLREMKKNIEEFTNDVLDTFRSIKTYTFNYNFEEDGAKKTLGLMLDEAPEIIWNTSGDSIDMYSSIGYLFTGLKQSISVLDNLKTRIEALEQKLGA